MLNPTQTLAYTHVRTCAFIHTVSDHHSFTTNCFFTSLWLKWHQYFILNSSNQ